MTIHILDVNVHPHWKYHGSRYLKIFFFKTTWPILTKLDTMHFCVKSLLIKGLSILKKEMLILFSLNQCCGVFIAFCKGERCSPRMSFDLFVIVMSGFFFINLSGGGVWHRTIWPNTLISQFYNQIWLCTLYNFHVIYWPDICFFSALFRWPRKESYFMTSYNTKQ